MNGEPEEFIRVLLPRRQLNTQKQILLQVNIIEKIGSHQSLNRSGRDRGAFVQICCCQELVVGNLAVAIEPACQSTSIWLSCGLSLYRFAIRPPRHGLH